MILLFFKVLLPSLIESRIELFYYFQYLFYATCVRFQNCIPYIRRFYWKLYGTLIYCKISQEVIFNRAILGIAWSILMIEYCIINLSGLWPEEESIFVFGYFLFVFHTLLWKRIVNLSMEFTMEFTKRLGCLL